MLSEAIYVISNAIETGSNENIRYIISSGGLQAFYHIFTNYLDNYHLLIVKVALLGLKNLFFSNSALYVNQALVECPNIRKILEDMSNYSELSSE